jgi:eukaryotic-like serine/threonine-protein kinase
LSRDLRAQALPTQPTMINKTIAHYEILERLGEGGMGTVYRAVDMRLGRPVAVKLLRGEAAVNAESKKRFIQEAKAASALNHPHIITIYDIGQDGGVDFIAMEYVSGPSLARLIGRTGLKIGEALKYAVQIADALATAHAAGIVHRDLKPANMMISDKGSIKLLDFGLAKLTDAGSFDPVTDHVTTETAAAGGRLQTEAGTILGTTAYMSPEQAEGQTADARSDVFSFGAVLYEMVTGRRAFQGETKMSTLAAILAREPEPPSRLIPELPRDLDKVIARCLRKSPDRRWQSMADLKIALEDLREESESGSLAVPKVSAPARWRMQPALVAATIAAVAASALAFSAWRWISRIPLNSSPRPSLTRLTSDVSWTDYPAISSDGKILAYASDRSGESNLDIWIQQVPDGSPVRLTHHSADDIEPTFSADGSKIAFQSSRDGGGIYVIPTLGGEERLLAERGFSPRFSPDGTWIAYGMAEPTRGQIYVAPAGGGPATPIAPEFYQTQAPVWSPDGRYLLFWGQRERDAPPENNVDWYLAPVTGGAPIRTDARRVLMREGFEAFRGLPLPDAWVRSGSRLVFHGHVGDSWNMWQVTISPETWQVTGAPQRVTFGTTDEAAASVTLDGRMVFISRTTAADVWSLPIDADRGKVMGPLKRITQDTADDYDPTLSESGETLAFRSRRAGRFDVLLKDLRSGEETVLVQSAGDDYPAISRDGKNVAYSLRQDGKMPIFVVPARGGPPKPVCGDCGEVEQWSPDGSGILYVTGDDPSGVGFLSIASSQHREWLRHPGYGIFYPRFSPSGDWLSFNARLNNRAPARAFVASVQSSSVAAEKEWVLVSEDGDAPSWSPDGNLLYFWSNRDGSPCLWAQRLDPVTKRTTGSPLSIQHFHSRGLSWRNLYLGAPDIAVARDKVVFTLGEHTGNIWMTDLPPMRD